MMYSDIPSAQTLVLYFKSRGVKHIVISPGSRNAPLTLSFSKNSFFSCYSIVDERCAAFFALGMAQQLREPVAVVCTSGSALLNYYPAVAEAFYSDIPLIVVSADRPSYRIDIGDGQTIRQENVLEKHIGYSANLKQDISHAPEKVSEWGKSLLAESQEAIQEYNERELVNALQIARWKSTPVHINIPFEEPLYGVVEKPALQIAEKKTDVPINSDEENWSDYASIWKQSGRKMILVGVNQPNVMEKAVLEALAQDGNALVFTETTSNMHHPEFFPSIDSIIAPIEKSENKEDLFKALQPEILVTFGGLIVSKKIKAFLRKYQPKEHWHIDPKKAHDTFFCLSKHVKANPNDFFGAVLPSETEKSAYKTKWQEVKKHYEARRKTYLDQILFSDFTVFDQVMQYIPKGYQVHLANSSTVRYTQLFPMDASLKVFCNRGTSGIDGSTSTAVGASIHAVEPTLLITGDLSFFYDSNGLWNTHIRPDFRIILINNSGGGIFRILPGKEDTEEFSTFFETHHGFTAEHLAQMFGFDHFRAEDEVELANGLEDFYATSLKPKILEICTPRLVNNKILLGYFDFIS
ncbi:2-succinyl-5-enolpyruvyl-6-hydroxy-3-cyclohexene-1-carboxylic-acid synthase [Muricauda sp. CAU 1633]|uniref:2-succinyl-5-enolpyruvyl-6-hydroxy-3- cyclohexene-1-carboxylic-acid synthase n=1 Tax=Allomuricauda sp. CAU 1633 TaxID=2816036 RepID=UPI001A8E2AEF|nr:2-succinyl-5-enolpyruvyl-6-hydroxy-3-cyclohexene-1-carboxylic-acid synthase [Muricauda sp. CAU 1633]MBO0323398.1 2-succinyl-5-enolpyruvyl-6-hydroxy-3-cyclohexene-1-carboxylic-acid synthase [Muricauda sp. CAU 1633]